MSEFYDKYRSFVKSIGTKNYDDNYDFDRFGYQKKASLYRAPR